MGFAVPWGDTRQHATAAECCVTVSSGSPSRRTACVFLSVLITGSVVIFTFLAPAGKPAPRSRHPAVASPHHHASVTPSAASEDPVANELLTGLPGLARQAILAQVGDGKIKSLSKSIDEGVIVFEIEFTKPNEEPVRSFSVDCNGDVLSSEVFESELPPGVKAVLGQEFRDAAFSEIEREPDDDGKYLYAIEMISEGRTNSLTIGERGDWWSLALEQEQTPAAVRQTVSRLWDGFKITGVRKTSEEGEVTYEFDGEKNGALHRLTAAPDGRVTGQQEEVAVDQLPLLVKDNVTKLVGDGESIRITRVIYDEAVSFDVSAFKDGKALEFSVGPAGQVIEPGDQAR